MRKLIAIGAFLGAAFLVACGGGGGGGSSGVTPVACTPPQLNVGGVCTTPVADRTPPVLTLATLSPASLTTTISVTANEDLGGNVSITVKNGTTTVAGSTALNTGNRGMTWTSTSGALSCNTAYDVVASSADLASNVGTATFMVTTVGCPDATPPVVTVTTTSVSLTGTIQISSNESLSAFTVSVKSGATAIAGNGVLNADKKGVTWTPANALPCGVKLTVFGTAADMAGNNAFFLDLVATAACPVNVLHYTDKVVALWTNGYPYLLGLNGSGYTVTALQNLTGQTLIAC